jgi:hypothetical protein
MMRAARAVLLGAGVFFLFTAALIWWYVGPSLLKAPLNQNTTTVAEAQGATYLKVDSATKALSIETGAALTATRRVHADPKQSSSGTVVYDVGLVLMNSDNDVVKAYTDRVASDRKTGQAVACCNENVDGTPVKHEGLSYKFPFGTERTSYQFYDVLAKKAYPMRFKESTTLQGVEVYRFEQEITDQFLEDREVPGTLVGQPTVPTVKAELVYSNLRTVWIEPVTGSIVKGAEQQKQELKADGSKTAVLDATLTFNDKTVTERINEAKNGKAAAVALKGAPVVLIAVGLLLLVLGILLLRTPRRVGTRRAESRTHARSGV